MLRFYSYEFSTIHLVFQAIFIVFQRHSIVEFRYCWSESTPNARPAFVGFVTPISDTQHEKSGLQTLQQRCFVTIECLRL